MMLEKEQADAHRAEAKRTLNRAIGLPENSASEAINRAVDHIISAAILEIAVRIDCPVIGLTT